MRLGLAWLALMAALGCVGGCSRAFPAPGAEPQAPPLIGSWRTKVQFKEGALADLRDLEFMYSFNSGGTLTQSSNYDGTPPVPPGYGVWRQTGPRQFELKYAFYAPAKFVKVKRSAAWVPSGQGTYHETLQLSADGKSYTSHIVYELVNPAGAPIRGGGEGQAAGTRIVFDPTY